MKIGQIVYSKAGRDKGSFLMVTEDTPNGVLVADGKERPLERPKRKNKKHLSETGNCLSEKDFGSNKALKKALSRFKANKDEF